MREHRYLCCVLKDAQTAPISYSWGAWKNAVSKKAVFILKNLNNCCSVFFSLCLKDDCLKSLTRFAAAHWTVSSLSAVQGHFCTLLACKFTTLFYFFLTQVKIQKDAYRKIVSLHYTKIVLYVEVLSNRPKATIFTGVPIYLVVLWKKKNAFLLVCSSKMKDGYLTVKEFYWSFFPAFLLLLLEW